MSPAAQAAERFDDTLPAPGPAPRIIMLTTDRQKIDRRVVQQADSLEAAGWDVTIVGLPLDPGEEEIDPRAVRVVPKSKSAIRQARILPIYRWVQRLMPMNAPLMRLMKTFTWRALVDQETFYLRLYEETLSRLTADVFVAHDLPMLPAGYHAAKRCGAKLVYDSHELYSEQEFSGWIKRRWQEIEAKYIPACDRVITINSSIAAELEKRYGVANVEVISNAEHALGGPANQKLFHKIFNLPDESKILLYQGGLSANRHLEILVEGMRDVRNANIHLVILGDGQLRKKLKKIVAKHDIIKRVHFHDAVSQKELLRYTSSADGGIIPYQATCLNNYLCTPNKLFEFIAAGLPVLAADMPEMRKIIRGSDIGLLGDMQTPQSLARLVDEFFRDTIRLDAWRDRVKETRKTICWQEEEKKVVAIYASLRSA